MTFRHPQHVPAIGGFKDLAACSQEEFVRRKKLVSTPLTDFPTLRADRRLTARTEQPTAPPPSVQACPGPIYIPLGSKARGSSTWGKGRGTRGGGLGREQGACSACSTFFRGLREISFFVHNQGRGFKAPAKWFISEKDVRICLRSLGDVLF